MAVTGVASRRHPHERDGWLKMNSAGVKMYPNLVLRGRGLSRGGGSLDDSLAHVQQLHLNNDKLLSLKRRNEVAAHTKDKSLEEGDLPVTPPPLHHDSLTEEAAEAQSRRLSDSVSWSFGTGNMSARSSIFSWENDDEYDKQASATVRKMFHDIDSLLYEDRVSGSRQLIEECSVWSSAFPHLRLLGRQLIRPYDEGTQTIPRDPIRGDRAASLSKSSTSDDLFENGKESIQRLQITGTASVVSDAPVNDSQSATDSESTTSADEFSFLHEEIFAQDGYIEECIARDCYPVAGDGASKSGNRSLHHGIPSVTPTAVVKETIIDELFDRIWSDAVPLLVELLSFCLKSARRRGSGRRTETYNQDNQSMNAAHALRRQEGLKTSPSVLDHRPPSSAIGTLKELMTIRSVSLQQRAPSVTSNLFRFDDQTIIDEAVPPSSSDFNRRPFTSQTLNGLSSTDGKPMPRPLSVRNASDHNLYEKLLSSKATTSLKSRGTSRLQPIHQNDRGKLFTTEQTSRDVSREIVRGTRLSAVNGTTEPFPLPWGPRTGLLPPIAMTDGINWPEPFLAEENTKRSPKNKRMTSNSRISSAAGEETRRLQKERSVLWNNDLNRPNTTQTTRSSIGIGRQQSTTHVQTSKPMQTAISKLTHPISDFVSQSRDYAIDEETADEIDDFVLWGRGPPLLSHQSKKGRGSTWAGNVR